MASYQYPAINSEVYDQEIVNNKANIDEAMANVEMMNRYIKEQIEEMRLNAEKATEARKATIHADAQKIESLRLELWENTCEMAAQAAAMAAQSGRLAHAYSQSNRYKARKERKGTTKVCIYCYKRTFENDECRRHLVLDEYPIIFPHLDEAGREAKARIDAP